MFYDLKDKKPQNSGENWVAPNATIIGDVTLEKNSSIWFNAVLRGDIENIHIGEGSNIQDGSVLHTDPGCPLKVGKDVTVGHLVMLHGCQVNPIRDRLCAAIAFIQKRTENVIDVERLTCCASTSSSNNRLSCNRIHVMPQLT